MSFTPGARSYGSLEGGEYNAGFSTPMGFTVEPGGIYVVRHTYDAAALVNSEPHRAFLGRRRVLAVFFRLQKRQRNSLNVSGSPDG